MYVCRVFYVTSQLKEHGVLYLVSKHQWVYLLIDNISFRKISEELLPPGSHGIFRQKSQNAIYPHLSLGGYARAATQSIGNIGNILSRKMAASTSQPSIPWPNSKDDYELGKVIGQYC